MPKTITKKSSISSLNSENKERIEILELEKKQLSKELYEETQLSQKLSLELAQFKKTRDRDIDEILAASLTAEKEKTAIAEQNSERYKLQVAKLEKELIKLKKKSKEKKPHQVNLKEYLTNLEKRWNDHLTSLDKQEFYQGQEEIIQELIPFIEQALESTNDINQWTNDLLAKWTTDYIQWKDDSKDLFNLQEVLISNSPNPLYQLIINKKISKEDLEDKAIELEIKVIQFEKDLKNAYQRNLQKTKEWGNLVKQSSKDLKSAVKAKASEYKSFINPNNPAILTKTAKDKLGMFTKEEIEETVNKLQEWENTFENKTPVEVKEELTISKEKAFKSHLERRAMEIERDGYKEDSERMVNEVDNYYQEYKRFLDLLSKERDRTTQLENQIYSLGVEPIPEEESDNENNLEDNTSKVNSLNGGEETHSINSDQENNEEVNEENQTTHIEVRNI